MDLGGRPSDLDDGAAARAGCRHGISPLAERHDSTLWQVAHAAQHQVQLFLDPFSHLEASLEAFGAVRDEGIRRHEHLRASRMLKILWRFAFSDLWSKGSLLLLHAEGHIDLGSLAGELRSKKGGGT